MSVQIIEIIKTLQREGKSIEAITEQLLKDGYTQTIIEAGFVLASEEAVAITKAAPTLSQLLTIGWDGVKKQPRLIMLIAAPTLLAAVLAALLPYAASNHLLQIALWGAIALTMLLYVVILGAALYIFTNEMETPVSIQSALSWSLRQTPKLIWLYILMSLLLWGGLLLFMLPAVILFVSAYFAQIAFVKEGARGMNAIFASRRLVSGRWWLVASRVLGFLALLLVPTIIFSLIESIVLAIWKTPGTQLAAAFIDQIIIAIITAMALAAFYHFYKYLRNTAPETETVSSLTKVGYWGFIGLGLVMAVLIAVVIVKFDSLETLETQFHTDLEIEAELSEVLIKATEYALLSEDVSFEGVCPGLIDSMITKKGVACNDSDDEWALEVEQSGQVWCVGTRTAPKRVQTKLGDRTNCLPLP